MIPVTIASLAVHSGNNPPEGLQRLPWINGTLLSARLLPTDIQGTALLVLGGYRLRAQVPPATPMGHAWLLLVNHEMPARFRLLGDAEAAQVIIRMLQELRRQGGRHTPERSGRLHAQKTTSSHEKLTSHVHNETTPGASYRIAMGGHQPPPFAGIGADFGRAGKYTEESADDTPCAITTGMDASGVFHIRGRIDLKQLGALAFSLSGENHRPWRLRVFADNSSILPILRQDFSNWIGKQRRAYPDLMGDITAGLPDGCLATGGEILA